MNSPSIFTWEQAKKIADLVVFQKFGEHLKDSELEVLQGAWEGLTYEKMAEDFYRSVNYIRGDVGPKLWQKLSDALAEEVTKKNFKAALERASSLQQTVPPVSPIPDAAFRRLQLPFPEGSVPLDSPFYLEREGVESVCYGSISKAGSLTRIKAPKLMGKTSLMARIIARGKTQNYQTANLDLSDIERGIIVDLDKFLRWFCLMVGRQCQLDSRLQDLWDTEILGSNDNCTVYFEEYLLPEINGPLLLGLDNVDRIFPCIEVVEDFLGMLRSWHEKGKTSQRWRQLRLVMAYSTECYVPLDMNQSPFNAGIPVELQEFNRKQVKQWACLYGLDWNESQVDALMGTIGGHPYLVGLALYEIGSGRMDLDRLLQSAPTEAGIYSSHLRRHLETLQSSPELFDAFQQVVASPEPIELNSMQIYKLHSMGLVRQNDNRVQPRCNLYREYFHRGL
ncbi:AAA-like domain-containing protein [Altericista sp. CCNU0014]|uniref:AAA-like domain-containing protein n=1 Tax=Altericista sp. CCNU0014 TaxID=3082949 RepID=UPI00384D6EAB